MRGAARARAASARGRRAHRWVARRRCARAACTGGARAGGARAGGADAGGERGGGPVDDLEAGYRAGREVLLDTLLLARCDYLLKAASSVGEFATYFSPRLARDSFDFNVRYRNGSLPAWAASLGESPEFLRAAKAGFREPKTRPSKAAPPKRPRPP